MKKLTEVSVSEPRVKLSRTQRPFRIVFEVKLDNGYEVKDMTKKHISEFHRFLSDTVYKGLSVLNFFVCFI